MKKRICLALGALVIAMSIFSPMLVWAEPEGENPGGSTEPPADRKSTRLNSIT